ncbi:conjugal transfer protein TraF [Thiohalophilus thiocyanatoxydans]|uniref:F plasmid transfer operon protein TraF n=1 Tax=Thiohalophilus thiocyanatoxydans TaxID=381308 RepID=A0A4R8IMP3_9GAMM|nr:conjugal transfer protein TraF [Thiohalophilus thiocyanatoxydans]TDY01708.1 F plasmid transfer operon protein TraF [Thiohalophilus thiocyanatoxydans]
MQLTRPLLTAALLGLSLNATALPFATYEARSAGMGTTGVASSNIASAPFSNPAMLAAQRFEDDFSLTAGLGVQAIDNENLLDDIEDFNDAYDANDLAGMDAAASRADGKRIDVLGNGALNVGFSAEKWAGAVSANRYIQANSGVQYDASNNGADSTIDLVGLEVTEIGVSLARQFGRFSVGFTPKSQSVTSYDSDSVLLRNTEDLGDLIDAATEEGEKDHGGGVNADIGLVYRLGEESRWQAGVVVRNISEQTYTTSGNRTVKIEPQSRAGLAYNGDVFTVAVDYDLSENDPLVAGGDKTQMLAAGLEFDIFSTLKLRAGYAKNTADVAGPDDDLLSAGLGLNILGLQADAAVMGNDNNLSGFVQLGVQF